MIKQIATMTVAAGAIVAGMFVTVDYAFSIPEVHKSYSTNRCLKVQTYPGLLFGHEAASCERLPSRYDIVWHQ